MAGISPNRLRIAVDSILSVNGYAKDVLTGKDPVAWQCGDLQVELGVFDNAVVGDLTDVDNIVLEVKYPQNLLAAPLVAQTVEAVDLDLTMDATTWGNGTKQHAIFDLSSLDMNIELQGDQFRQFLLFFCAFMNDGNRIPLGVSRLNIQDSGFGDVGATTITAPGARMKNGKLQIKDPDTNLYYDLVPRVVNGVPVTSLEGAGES